MAPAEGEALEDDTDPAENKVKPSWGVRSVVNAICMMLTGAASRVRPNTALHPTLANERTQPHTLAHASVRPCHRRHTRPSVPPPAAEGTGNVELPDSRHFGRCSSRRPMFKPTCDAANLTNAPKGRRGVTTVILQLLAFSVCPEPEPTNVFAGLVHGMVQKPQSCTRAFILRIWFGKDDTANVPRAAPQCAPAHRRQTDAPASCAGESSPRADHE